MASSKRQTAERGPRRDARVLVGLVASAAIIACQSAGSPPQPGALDCPLRDAPFSTQTLLMDVLLSPAASAVVNRHMNSAIERLPPSFARAEAPSFSAIMTVEMLAGMARIAPEVLATIDRELSRLPVSEADRIARCARYDDEAPELDLPDGRPRLLVFEKITGFRDDPSVAAAQQSLGEMAERNGWALVSTDRGGAMRPEILERFDAVVWNNVSGDVLTLSQRGAFRRYIERGGGFVGIHGSGGDPIYLWDWYADELLGARFIGHPSDPQFQDARIVVEENPTGIAADLAPGWTLHEEWYSFRPSPRETGSMVIATLDESSYSPIGRQGDLRMGDHPIAWARCLGEGRSFYSAIGHRPEVYTDPHHVKLLEQGIRWAAGDRMETCRRGG